MSNKSKPGVCDICGCAVVRLTDGDPCVIDSDCMGNVWTKVKIPAKGTYIVNGHKYVDSELVRVLCSVHCKEYTPPGLDAKGGSGVESDGFCVRKLGLG